MRRHGRSDDDFANEIRAHLALETDRLIREGLDPEQAEAAARRRFGGVARVQEHFYDSRRVRWLDDARRDVRYALRALARSPGFTAVAVVTLALGIGANTAIFSVVQAVILRAPFKDADRVVRIVEDVDPGAGEASAVRVAGLHRFERDILRSQAPSLSHLGTYVPATVTVGGSREAFRLNGVRLSPALLAMLGERPLLGRLFEPREESPGLEAGVILSHGCWQRYFDASPDVIGQVVTLDGVGHSIVGVMPAGFRFPDADAQFWVPYAWPMQARLVVTARLADGRSIQSASEEVATILRQVREDPRFRALGAPPPPPPPPPGLRSSGGAPLMAAPPPPGPESRPAPSAPPSPRFRLVPLHEQTIAPVRSALLVLTVAVAFVLLIACVNVGNLLLARAAARRGEMAVRMALGAGRARLVRQLLTESVLLALVGGALGTALAFAGVRLLRALGATLPGRAFAPAAGLPRLEDVGIDGTALVFTLAVSLATGVAFGALPALFQARDHQADPLREHAASAWSGFSLVRRHRVRALLVVAEIALALLLFLSAALLIRSFAKLSTVDPGFDSAGVLTFQVVLPSGRSTPAFRDALVSGLATIPGVRAVGYADQLPMGPPRGVMQLRTSADQPRVPPPPPAPGGSRLPQFPDLRLVSHDFLRALGARVVEGRGLDARDGASGAPVLVVNRALARSGLLGPTPLGSRIYGYGEGPWEIVGIVDDVRQSGLDVEPGPQVFVDVRQYPPAAAPTWFQPSFAVRTGVDPLTLLPAIRQLVRGLDAQATVDSIATLDRIVANSVVRPRLYAVLLGIFAAVAVALAVVGIYGVMAYAVTQRTREIGIRMALGAARVDVLGLVLAQVLPLVAAGLLLGLAGAVALTRMLAGLLYGLTPRDPATFAVATLLFASVAVVAAVLPARRAAHVDPLVALRLE